MYEPLVPDHLQVWRVLPWCAGAAGLHQVPEQTRHRHVDLGGSRSVSLSNVTYRSDHSFHSFAIESLKFDEFIFSFLGNCIYFSIG